MSEADLEGRGFVVTGGSGHLGAPMVRSLLRAGGVVVAIARGADGLAALADSCGADAERLETLAGDVRSEDTVERAIEMVDARQQRLAGWVNNANTASGGGLLFGLDRQELTDAVTALADLMMTTEQVASAMIDRDEHGAIVNVSSMYGLVAPDPRAYEQHPDFHNPPGYGAVKAGMLQFSRYAATHLAPYGIRVNSVSPGPFPRASVQEHRGFVQELERRVPLGRVGRAEEVAGAVRYLLSDDASYTTGTNIVIDGGWTAW
ncbi:MAG: SDR family oxidoreductase [Nitriliruptor sp.]|nr:MAG: SDR family oxidoreductase [Nitriliruptor sp.]